MNKYLKLSFLILLLFSSPAFAVQPKEILADPQLEARARVISEDLRCLVCQNQSIDDSDADLAYDLRVLVRQRLQAGDSNDEVKQYIVERYGDYVLLNPPFKPATILLWIGPFLMLLAGFLLVGLFFRNGKHKTKNTSLSFAVKDLKTVSHLKTNNKNSSKEKLILVLVIIIIVSVSAGLLYNFLGSPDLPAQPYAQRKHDSNFVMELEVEKLSQQLKINPSIEGYKRLADAYFILRNYDKAAEGYKNVIDLNGGSAEIWSEFGEAIVLSHDNLVVLSAQKAFSKALSLNPKEPRSRFYLGLLEAQTNQPKRAVAIWRDLEKDSKPGAPWMKMLKEHIKYFSGEVNSNPDVASGIMSLPPQEQQDMVRKMVNSLTAKMKNNPDNLEGWQLLARSYRVLGEDDKAKVAEKEVARLQNKSSNK